MTVLAAYSSFGPYGFQIRLSTEFFGMEFEFFRFFGAAVAHDDVEQKHSGFLTFDPIRRPFERRAAMFANPTHISPYINCSFDDSTKSE